MEESEQIYKRNVANWKINQFSSDLKKMDFFSTNVPANGCPLHLQQNFVGRNFLLYQMIYKYLKINFNPGEEIRRWIKVANSAIKISMLTSYNFDLPNGVGKNPSNSSKPVLLVLAGIQALTPKILGNWKKFQISKTPSKFKKME